MGIKIQCFLLERTNLARRSIRRYCTSAEQQCPHGYHNASAVTDAEVEYSSEWEGEGAPPTDSQLADPRWPSACRCGYAFIESDMRQVHIERLYRAPDGVLCVLQEAPPGAMWFASWYAESGWVGPDGRTLVVALPPGGMANHWIVDSQAASGGRWTRVGEPPLVVARPSILTKEYHGFLGGVDGQQPGILEEC